MNNNKGKGSNYFLFPLGNYLTTNNKIGNGLVKLHHAAKMIFRVLNLRIQVNPESVNDK